MKLQRHLDALKDDLEQLAALADDTVAEAARRLATALESSVRVRLLDVLSEAAAELSASLEHGHVEVRVAGGDPDLVFVEAEEEPGEPARGPVDDAFSARITLRLSEALKAQIEVAAARTSVSVNSWIVSALARSVSDTSRRGSGPARRRLTGYGRS
jgi:hypothetical protein